MNNPAISFRYHSLLFTLNYFILYLADESAVGRINWKGKNTVNQEQL
jgi:hypothetical protein